jgi:hypothetical protein
MAFDDPIVWIFIFPLVGLLILAAIVFFLSRLPEGHGAVAPTIHFHNIIQVLQHRLTVLYQLSIQNPVQSAARSFRKLRSTVSRAGVSKRLS